MRRLDRRLPGSRLAGPALLSAVVLSVTSVIVAASPGAASAQETKLFQNSWFWGVHAGVTNLGTEYSSGSSAGTIGAEWLITRSVAGLYISYDQANFSKTAEIDDPSTSTGERPVSIHDMRTGSIAGVAFPLQLGNFRPYGGLGVAISVLGNATAQPVTASGGGTSAPDATVQQRVEDARSRSTIFAMGGGQWQTKRLAIYGQLTLMPASSDFLVNRAITQISAGVRYNFGPSIDR